MLPARHLLRVARVVHETADARSLVFEVPPALTEAFQYRSGQFLTLFVPVDGVVHKRCYSLASAPGIDAEHKVTVKRVEGGRVSTRLVADVSAGDSLEVEVPAGRFVLDEGEHPVVLMGGGSGITPLISIAKTALGRTSRRVRLFYANRDVDSVIFRDELTRLALEGGGRLEIVHHLDAGRGPPTAEAIRAMITEGATYFLCGPEPFMALVEATLAVFGVPGERVRVERFLSPREPAPAAADPGLDFPERVQGEVDGKEFDVPYSPGQTLLDAVLAGGIDAPYSCREGFCGCCAALLLEGKVTMDAEDALTPDAKKRGLILVCQARPIGSSCKLRFVEY